MLVVADEEGDLLGGLPRSRPGVRSGKRASARSAQPAPKAAARPAAKRVTKPKPARTAAKPPPKPRSAPPPPEPAAGTAEEALRLASGAAGAVLGTASSVTRGILRRLPKP